LPGTSSQAHEQKAQSAVKLMDGLTLSHHEMPIYTGQPQRDLTGRLVYGGGVVQHGPKIYVLYWGLKNSGGDPNGVEKLMNKFLDDVGGSNWLSTVTQYYDVVNGVTTDIDNPEHQFTSKGKVKQYIDDDSTTVPAHPTDAQIQSEAKKLADKFGGSEDASYVVVTPHNHNIQGFGTSYCAYHGAFSYNGAIIPYTVMPYIPDAGASCGAGFVNSPGTDDGVSIVEGHELAETQTDPGADYSGWGGSSGEIGDICAWNKKTSNQKINKGTFPVQPLYSDVAAGCTLTGPSGP
jgi:serine protease